ALRRRRERRLALVELDELGVAARLIEEGGERVAALLVGAEIGAERDPRRDRLFVIAELDAEDPRDLRAIAARLFARAHLRAAQEHDGEIAESARLFEQDGEAVERLAILAVFVEAHAIRADRARSIPEHFGREARDLAERAAARDGVGLDDAEALQ